MKKLPPKMDQCAEKHIYTDPLICLVDKHGRIVWASDDPRNQAGLVGSTIVETVSETDRDQIVAALARCFFKNETVEYTVTGNPSATAGGDRPVTWHVRLLPIHGSGGVSACCVCRVLPEYHAEITDDERKMLRLMCEDKAHREIAEVLFLSDSAIDTKIRNLKDKMGVRTIGGLVATALKESLI